MESAGSEMNARKAWPSRVLHLVDGTRGRQSSLWLDHVEDLISDRPDDVIIMVGGSACGRYGRVSDLPMLPGLGSNVLKRVLGKKQWSSASFDVVHAWGIRSASLASGLDHSQALAVTVDGFDLSDSQAVRAASVMLSGRAACSFGSTLSMEQAFELVGGSRRGSGGEEIICPILNPAGFHDRDENLRLSWGADADTMVMGIIGSPMDRLNLFDFASMASRCSMFHSHVVLVSPTGGSRRGDLVRWFDGVGLEASLVFDDRLESIQRVACSLDMAIAPSAVACRSRICDVAPVLGAASAGVPVILGVNHPALEYSTRNHLIHPSVMHGEHEATKWLIGALARNVAVDNGSRLEHRDRYLDGLKSLYERAASLSGSSRLIAAS